MTSGHPDSIAPAQIVGRGVISGSGRGVESFWEAIRGAQPGMESANPGDPRLDNPHYVRVAEPRETPEDLASLWMSLAIEDALAAADPVIATLDAPRVTLLGGTSLGGMTLFEEEHRGWWGEVDKQPAELPPWRASYFGPSSLAGERYATQGGWTVNTACSSAANGIGLARLWLARNRCDVAIVVGFDVVSPFVFAGFSGLNAVDPEATNPFGTDRRGLNMGEAAVALVMCRESDASTHGGARVVGYGSSCDAHHLTRPDLSGAGLQRAINWAMGDARCTATDIGLISAHGTGTPFNDTMEAAAFQSVFGKQRPPLHCAKPVTGHTLGASGAIDALVVTLALEHGVAPRTYTRTAPDPDLAFHPSAEDRPLEPGCLALSTSSGFGGSNAALVFAPSGAGA